MMDIHQGAIYWAPVEDAEGAGSGIVHPHVVIQDDIINRSRVATVVVCGITTNMKRQGQPGTILLEVGEGNLPKQSIVVVSQVSTVAKAALGAYIGTLRPERVAQIFATMQFLQRSTDRE